MVNKFLEVKQMIEESEGQKHWQRKTRIKKKDIHAMFQKPIQKQHPEKNSSAL
ncbi:hypothetical protein IMZ31_23000 (plasmid) [Pontibacillus sp. ALD_SL1]|uniref:hypothetical protein n=1 Tax=Pontibacillus sp. ALD_SL1 TaxID=2777185 RepID=UPI001A9725C6|nr:hypothetical protein [Pontibacillus sp. ALD_SL1]QST02322.1 hypothetical protein IMZ31_23000 [Pontibacillus sp. ALD_SL1]